MTQCYWWWLPRETRGYIHEFYDRLVQIELDKKAKFAPILREVLVLGVLPESFRQYIRERAKQPTYNFSPNRLVYFRDVYINCREVRDLIRAYAPRIDIKQSTEIRMTHIREADAIWKSWRWDDPNLTMHNLWTEIFQLAKGMTEVYRRKK